MVFSFDSPKYYSVISVWFGHKLGGLGGSWFRPTPHLHTSHQTQPTHPPTTHPFTHPPTPARPPHTHLTTPPHCHPLTHTLKRAPLAPTPPSASTPAPTPNLSLSLPRLSPHFFGIFFLPPVTECRPGPRTSGTATPRSCSMLTASPHGQLDHKEKFAAILPPDNFGPIRIGVQKSTTLSL